MTLQQELLVRVTNDVQLIINLQGDENPDYHQHDFAHGIEQVFSNFILLN